MTNLADNLTRTAEQHGDRPEVKLDDLVVTYAELDLRAFAKERLAAYEYPRVVWIVDELPKGPTGKILRREVSAPEGGSK